MTAALEWGEWSAARPGRFTPGKDPVPIVQETGWAPGSVWTMKILVPPGFDPRTLQPVVSRYIDWATRPTCFALYCLIFMLLLAPHPCTKKDLRKVNKFYSIIFYSYTNIHSAHISTPLFVHRCLWHCNKWSGKSKYSLIKNFFNRNLWMLNEDGATSEFDCT